MRGRLIGRGNERDSVPSPCAGVEETFDFLGYTFGRMYSARTGQARIGFRPSKQSIRRMVRKIHALTAEAMVWQETTVNRPGNSGDSVV